MPVNIPVEWAVVKMPAKHLPWIRRVGFVLCGTSTLTEQDQPNRMKAAMVVSTEEQLFAMNVSEMLNREIDHGGYWMVSWSDPDPVTKAPTEMVCRWLDQDKDIQFRNWIEGPFAEIALHVPLEDIVGSCENCWNEWLDTIKHKLEISPNQMVKAQMGERVDLPDFGPRVFGA